MKSCGGKFVKIKEPDDYGKKGSKRKRDDSVKDGARFDGAALSNDKKKNESSGNDIAKWFSKRATDGNDSSCSNSIIRTINDRRNGESSNEKPRTFFSGTGQVLGSLISNGSEDKDRWYKPSNVAKGINSTKTDVRTINDNRTGEANNDRPRSLSSGTGNSLGSGSSDKSVSKGQWFKRKSPAKDTIAIKTVIRTIKDNPSDEPSREKPRSFFTGSGKSLATGRSNGSLSRDQWINRLMEKQKNTQKVSDSNTKKRKTFTPSNVKPEEENDRKSRNIFTANRANDCKNESEFWHDRPNRSSKKPFSNSTENYVDMRMRRLNDKYKSGTSTVSSANMDDSLNKFKSYSRTNESSNRADESLQFEDSITERTNISTETEAPLLERIAWRGTDAISRSNNPASYESFRIMSRTTEAARSSKQTEQVHDTLAQTGGNGSLIVISESRTPIELAEELVDCPVCPEKVPISSINLHLDRCLSRCN